jgi:hypothetical protein
MAASLTSAVCCLDSANSASRAVSSEQGRVIQSDASSELRTVEAISASLEEVLDNAEDEAGVGFPVKGGAAEHRAEVVDELGEVVDDLCGHR